MIKEYGPNWKPGTVPNDFVKRKTPDKSQHKEIITALELWWKFDNGLLVFCFIGLLLYSLLFYTHCDKSPKISQWNYCSTMACRLAYDAQRIARKPDSTVKPLNVRMPFISRFSEGEQKQNLTMWIM